MFELCCPIQCPFKTPVSVLRFVYLNMYCFIEIMIALINQIMYIIGIHEYIMITIPTYYVLIYKNT